MLLSAKTERLLRGTGDLANQLEQDAKLLSAAPLREKGEKLVAALKNNQLQDPIFDDLELANFSLLSHYLGEISLVQIATILLRWGAIHQDYKGKYKNIRFYDVSYVSGRSTLLKFLQLQKLPGTEIAFTLTKEQEKEIFGKLQAPDVVESERGFITIEVDEKDVQEILKGIKQLAVELLFPLYMQDRVRILIPSFTIIQTVLDVLTPRKVQLVPMIGDTTAGELAVMHKSNLHPFGLSFPGFLRSEADGFTAGCFGFSMHEVYHVILMNYIANMVLFERLRQRIKEYGAKLATPQSKRIAGKLAFGVTDAEFRTFTFSDQTQVPLEDSSNEYHVLIALITMHLKTLLSLMKEYEDSKAVNTRPNTSSDKSTTSTPGQEADDKLEPSTSLAKMIAMKDNDEELIVEIYRSVFIDVISNHESWQQDGLSVAKLIRYLDSDFPDLLSKHWAPFGYQSGATMIYSEIFHKLTLLCGKLLLNGDLAWISQYNTYKSTLIELVVSGQVEPFSRLLDEPMLHSFLVDPLSLMDKQKDGLLVVSVKNKRPEMVKFLLSKLAPSAVELGNLLNIAARQDDNTTMSILLDHGANPYFQDADKMAALDYAILQGNVDGIMLFLRRRVVLSQAHYSYLKDRHNIPANSVECLTAYFSYTNELDEILMKYSYRHDDPAALLAELTSLDERNPYCFLVPALHSSLPTIADSVSDRLDSGMYSHTLSSVNSVEIFEVLVRMGNPDQLYVDATDSSGMTTLASCFQFGREQSIPIIRQLIAHGAQVVQRDHQGDSILIYMIKNLQGYDIHRKLLLLNYLLSIPEVIVGYQEISLFLDFVITQEAAKWRPEIVELCQKLIVRTDLNSPIHVAREGMEDSFFGFFKPRKIEKTSIWQEIRFQNIYHRTGFSFFGGDRTLVGKLYLPIDLRRLCIEQGADVNAPDLDGNTELTNSVLLNDIDYARFLLQRGADVNQANKNGTTPLHLAVANGKATFISLFVEQGAAIVEDDQYQTPLDLSLAESTSTSWWVAGKLAGAKGASDPSATNQRFFGRLSVTPGSENQEALASAMLKQGIVAPSASK